MPPLSASLPKLPETRFYNGVFRAHGYGAVYGLCGVDRGVPEVWGSAYDMRELLNASVKLMDGVSPLKKRLPACFEKAGKWRLKKLNIRR